MGKSFAKRLAAVLLAVFVAAALPMASAFAAEPAPVGYTITFSGGEYGQYTKAFVDRLEGAGYTVTPSADMRTVTVQLTGSDPLPQLPGNGELESTSSVYKVWIVGTAQMLASGYTTAYPSDITDVKCASNYTFTPTFFLGGGTDIQYVFRFLVNGTEAEAAPAQFGVVPANTFKAGYELALAGVPTPAEYTLNVAATVEASNGAITQSENGLVLTGENPAEGQTLEFTFYFDQITHVNVNTVEVGGDTIVNYNDVTLVGGAGVAGGGGAGEETLPDEETPQAGGETIPDENTPQAGGGETLPDEETPQAEPAAASGLNLPLMVGGAVVLVLAVLLLVLAATRKRRAAEGDEE